MKQSPKPLGRPRDFDRDLAVQRAMRLFWRHGYEGVSIADLTSAIGIGPPSLYAAFGSKAALYRETIALYEKEMHSAGLSDIDGPTLEEAVRKMLCSAVRTVTNPERERGCMISSGMVACGAEHDNLARELARRRNAMRDGINQRLRRWLDEAEAASLARYLLAVLQGLSIQARDGATAAELGTLVDHVVAGLACRMEVGRKALKPC